MTLLKDKLDKLLTDTLIDIFKNSTRGGTAFDYPEGSRYIKISDTLALKLTKQLEDFKARGKTNGGAVMNEKIQIVFFLGDSKNSFKTVEWPFVPRVGESVHFGGCSVGIVEQVFWSTCANGSGNPLPDKPAVAIQLKKI